MFSHYGYAWRFGENTIFKLGTIKRKYGVIPILFVIGTTISMVPSCSLLIALTRPDVNYKPWYISKPWERIMDLNKPKCLKLLNFHDPCNKPRADLVKIYDELNTKERELLKQNGPILEKHWAEY